MRDLVHVYYLFKTLVEGAGLKAIVNPGNGLVLEKSAVTDAVSGRVTAPRAFAGITLDGEKLLALAGRHEELHDYIESEVLQAKARIVGELRALADRLEKR